MKLDTNCFSSVLNALQYGISYRKRNVHYDDQMGKMKKTVKSIEICSHFNLW